MRNKTSLLPVLLFPLLWQWAAFSQGAQRVKTDAKFQVEWVDPVRTMDISPGHHFFDFGKDAFGKLTINVKTNHADTVIIRLGERCSGENAVDRNPGGTIRYQMTKLFVSPANVNYAVLLPPDKRNFNPPAVALPDSFGVIMPFRYCEIENLNVPAKEIQVRQKVYHYEFSDNASLFSSSDSILNRIWELCKYSMKATSFAGYYVDGDRERIPYEADAYINQLSHYAVDNEYTLARRTILYFIAHPTWPTEWTLSTVLMFYNDYMYTGDISALAENYEALKIKTLTELEREDGLISTKSEKLNDDMMLRLGFKDTKQRIRDIVDWPPAQKDTEWKLSTTEGGRDGYDMTSVNTVVNSYHYIDLKLMAEIAGWLGKNNDAEHYRKQSELVKRSINEKLFDRDNGRYVDGEGSAHSSIHANMFPLAFGIVPEEKVRSVVAFIKTRGMACSVYGAQFLLEGLCRAGEADYALELMTSTSERSWWNMIRSGSTITMEAWDIKYKPNLDLNHAWGAAPGNIISRDIWGIKPSKPGYAEVTIKPQLSRLSTSHIRVPTAKGPIDAEYARKKQQDEYNVELPAGMKGTFVIARTGRSSITLNGTIIESASDSVALATGKNKIAITR